MQSYGHILTVLWQLTFSEVSEKCWVYCSKGTTKELYGVVLSLLTSDNLVIERRRMPNRNPLYWKWISGTSQVAMNLHLVTKLQISPGLQVIIRRKLGKCMRSKRSTREREGIIRVKSHSTPLCLVCVHFPLSLPFSSTCHAG